MNTELIETFNINRMRNKILARIKNTRAFAPYRISPHDDYLKMLNRARSLIAKSDIDTMRELLFCTEDTLDLIVTIGIVKLA